MSLAEDVDLEEYVTAKDDLSGADIKAVCTEAGLLALRERRMRVTKADFTEAREKVRKTYNAVPFRDSGISNSLLKYSYPYRSFIGRMRAHQRACTYSRYFLSF